MLTLDFFFYLILIFGRFVSITVYLKVTRGDYYWRCGNRSRVTTNSKSSCKIKDRMNIRPLQSSGHDKFTLHSAERLKLSPVK